MYSPDNYTIYPNQVVKIKTGISVHIGSAGNNLSALIIPRSGLGTQGLVLANTVGLIDTDYQGELIVAAYNRINANAVDVVLCRQNNWIHGDSITVRKGDRFAQLMFVPIVKPELILVDEFRDSTSRGEGGFGSTDG